MGIWVPKFVENYEDAQILCIHGEDLDSVSKEKYLALFFLKIYHMVQSAIDDSYDELVETLEQYMPDVNITDESNVQAIALAIIESDNFYYGFPDFGEEYTECTDIETLKEDDFLYDEFNRVIDGTHVIAELLDCNQSKVYASKYELSEGKYDRDFSKFLMTGDDEN